jgi:hypothetical protein
MAQLIGPAGTVRAAIQMQANSVNIVNTFWCKLTSSGTITQADLDTWTTAFAAAYKARFQSTIQGNVAFAQARSTLFADGTPLNVLESTSAMTGVGSAASSSEQAIAMVISWLSNAYWRGGKPRTYLPVGSGLVTTPKQFSAGSIATALTAAGNFRTDVNALTAGTTITGTQLGFVSFYSQGDLRVPPLFFAIGGAKVHPRVCHQRRRDGKWVA